MALPDIDVIKEIPGYKVILKAVLKSQIQQLVEQLAATTDEESVILTASISDGTLSHLGSSSGKSFLEDHDDIKSQFLGFCLKRHHKQQQEKLQQESASALQQSKNISEMQVSPRFPSRSPRFVSPVGSPFPAAHRRGARHEPYPMARPRRPSSETMSAPSAETSGQMIKVEPGSGIDGADNVTQGNIDNSSSVEANTSSNVDNDINLQNEATSLGLSADSGLSGLITMAGQQSGESSEIDANVSVKLEALPDNEMDLEITGVEPARQLEAQASWDPNNFELPGGSGGQGEGAAQGYAETVPFTTVSLEDDTARTGQNETSIKHNDGSSVIDQNDNDERFGEYEKRYDLPFVENDIDEIVTNNQDEESVPLTWPIHENTSSKTNHSCSICGKEFKSSYKLKRHFSIHSGDAIRCTRCGIIFPTTGALAKHNNKSHPQLYVCGECGIGMKSSRGFPMHRRLKHAAGGKILKCPYDNCKMVYLKMSTFEDHLNSHAKLTVDPHQWFICKCGKKFMYKKSLLRHSRKKHND